MKQRLKQLFVLFTGLSLMFAGTMSVAHTGLVDSATLMQMEDRAETIADIREILSKEALAEQMERMGVDPAQVSERIAQLTNEELATLQAQLHDLPAGGDLLAVIGLVFVVLLILELVGVIDIFRAI
ncbi:PA2779 family protein [Thioalkalicoccus limnaeus]|uniref:PA2779 family protein n=1 Tax=Thioalkalicoccus limnaeus TaxID=120681 RepID=A0ABV4BHU3_9GAMM